MNKVLVWDDFPLKNMGGPMGYCFQIHEYLKEHPTEQITFLSDLLPENQRTVWDESPFQVNPNNSRKSALYAFLKKINLYGIYKFVAEFKNAIRGFYFERYKKGCKVIPSYIDLNEFDIIHFHWTKDLSTFHYSHPEYKGKLMLTSHSPSPISEEVFASTPKWYKTFFWNVEFHHECKAYDLADYIMFPCEGAREPYEKYPKMKRTFARNNHKFIYNPSAILDLKVDESKMQKYSVLGIPQDAFVVTYFGRHISVKGYDILKEVGKRLLAKYENLYFLCAGKGDIEPLRHQRWIELGFINNVNELLPQSSLYVLPNRETYFDLITLEILRAGVPVILSNTGGNKYFHTYNTDLTKGIGFFEIDNVDDLIIEVEKMINLKLNSPQRYQDMKQANRSLFLLDFTIDKFVNKYIKVISELK